MKKQVLILLFTVLTLSGCDNKPNVALQSEIDALKKDVADIKTKQDFKDLVNNFDKFAYLTPGAEGYSPIRFDLGVLTVRLLDITPYANGSKVMLQFGNTLSASLNGLKITLDWGKVDDKGSPINDKAKTKEITLSQTIPGGAWAKTPVVLEGVPPTELGFVRVRDVSHSGIVLRK